MASTDFAENRRRMIDREIAGRGITDAGVVAPWARSRARLSCPTA